MVISFALPKERCLSFFQILSLIEGFVIKKILKENMLTYRRMCAVSFLFLLQKKLFILFLLLVSVEPKASTP